MLRQKASSANGKKDSNVPKSAPLHTAKSERKVPSKVAKSAESRRSARQAPSKQQEPRSKKSVESRKSRRAKSLHESARRVQSISSKSKRALSESEKGSLSKKSERKAKSRKSPEKHVDNKGSASHKSSKSSERRKKGLKDKLLGHGFSIGKSGKKTYTVMGVRLGDYNYVVKENSTSKRYAMKVEWKGLVTAKQLRKEVFVLTDANQQKSRMSHHFLKLEQNGRVKECFNYVIVSMHGYDLNDLRQKKFEGRNFSQVSAAKLSMQAFQAIHDLHLLGYIHRNINPTKFVVGEENPYMLYLIDFTLSYHFEQRFGIAKSSSSRKLPQLKRQTFLARNYHLNKDLHRKEDLEQWIYLSFNLFDRECLPWNEKTSDEKMLAAKKHLFSSSNDDFQDCYKNVPIQYKTIIRDLDQFADSARPDYVLIGSHLLEIKRDLKFDYCSHFDWHSGEEQIDKEDLPEELDLFDEQDENAHMNIAKMGVNNKDGANDQNKKKAKSPGHDERIAKLRADHCPEPEEKEKNAKAEKISKGGLVKGKNDYPTMNDVLSDWESEKEGKKDEQPATDRKNEEQTEKNAEMKEDYVEENDNDASLSSKRNQD